MLHIEIRGKYRLEDELIQGKALIQGAVQFKEGDTLQDAFVRGFLVGLPLIMQYV